MKTVIFDFDGTIADSFSLLVETFTTVAKRSKSLSPAEIEKLRGMTVPQILKYLGIKRWQLPRLLIRGKKAIAQTIDQIDPIPGIPAAIEELSLAGYNMIVLSTNSPVNINKFLARHGLSQYFNGVYGNVGIFNKAAALKKLIRKQKLDISDCIYIGDEVRDIEAAHKIGLDLVSAGWGFSTPKSLRNQNPQILLKNPKELKNAVEHFAELSSGWSV